MSTRQLRRYLASNFPPPPQDDVSEDEYEPLYVRNPSKSLYSGLVISSDSGDNESADSASEVAKESEASGSQPSSSFKSLGARPKKVSLNEKKKKRKARKLSASLSEEIDEVEKSLREVNALLGPPPRCPTPVEEPQKSEFDDIYQILSKNLFAANEMKRRFGSDDEAPHRRRPLNPVPQCRQTFIVPMEIMKHSRYGLTMSILRRENQDIYFVYNHNREYQRRHADYLLKVNFYHSTIFQSLEEAIAVHVEAKIQIVDSFLQIEEFKAAEAVLESAIAQLQYAAHPFFNFTGNIRLEYKFLENRTFHILVLKYMYLVSNKACHRTGLELGKLLLRLDPTDPVAVLTVIDVLALRAREFRWLIKAIVFWGNERQASYLYNIVYSNALAHFHVAVTEAEKLEADRLFKDAILRFPSMILRIKEACNDSKASVLGREDLFKAASVTTPHGLEDLIVLYATFSSSLWREPRVVKWFNRNIEELLNQYKADADVRQRAETYNKERNALFRRTPEQVMRHLAIVKSMESLVEAKMPPVTWQLACDPFPPANTIDRYRYGSPEPLNVRNYSGLFPEFMRDY